MKTFSIRLVLLLNFLMYWFCLFAKPFPALQGKVIDSLVQENNSFKIYANSIESMNAAIEKELVYYRAKEDYFTTALENQTAFYCTVIGVCAALVGFLSYGWYRRTLTKFKKAVEDLRAEQKEIYAETGLIRKDLYKTSYNVHISMADSSLESRDFSSSFMHNIAAAYAGACSQISFPEDHGFVYEKGVLKDAVRVLDVMVGDKTKDYQIDLKELRPTLMKYLNKIREANDEEISILCSMITVKYTDYLTKNK